MSVYADTRLLISYYILDSNSVSACGVINAMPDPLHLPASTAWR